MSSGRRVVDQLHEAADFEEIGKWIEGAKHYFLQCFTDRDTVPPTGRAERALQREAEGLRVSGAGKYVKDVRIRGVD